MGKETDLKEVSLKEALKGLDKVQVDESLISEIEDLYEVGLSDELKKIITLNKEGVFYNDMETLQGLSADDIIDESDDLVSECNELDLLPLFDVGDNVYIVYNLNKKCWSKFNASEEDLFDEAKSLSEYLK